MAAVGWNIGEGCDVVFGEMGRFWCGWDLVFGEMGFFGAKARFWFSEGSGAFFDAGGAWFLERLGRSWRSCGVDKLGVLFWEIFQKLVP